MAQFKTILSVAAAIVLAEFAPGLWVGFREINRAKATGLAAIAGGFLASFFSPLFWMLAISSFAVFSICNRSGSRALRVAFFRIPALITSCVGVIIVGLLAYLAFPGFRR